MRRGLGGVVEVEVALASSRAINDEIRDMTTTWPQHFAGLGTLPTHTPLFIVLLIGTVLLVGALTFVPALALGPVVEHLQMLRN